MVIDAISTQCSSVWSFLHTNFWHFEHFVFNLWLSFSLSALEDLLPTAASTHLKHLPDVVVKLSGFGRANTFLIPRIRLVLLITIIFNTFNLLYLHLENGFCVRMVFVSTQETSMIFSIVLQTCVASLSSLSATGTSWYLEW